MSNPFRPAACAALAILFATTPAPAWSIGEEPPELTFASFFRLPVGPRGLEVSDTLRRADGRTVRLVGYMVQQEQPVPGRFLLTPRPVQMSEHADGDANDLPPATVTVLLDASQRDRVPVHRAGPVALTGRLLLGREESAGRVSWFRLQLAPEALDTLPATAVAPRPLDPHR
jgi:hypothetical protein